MPKIISNVEKKLLDSTRKIIERDGFKDLSMKELAKESKISVGTIYNYFPEKSMILVKLVAEDWAVLVDRVNEYSLTAPNLRDGLKKIHEECLEFAQKHETIFSHFTTEENCAYHESYIAFIDGAADLLKFLGLRFGMEHTIEEYKVAASLFSYAVHNPDIPFDVIANAIEKILQTE